MCGYACINCGKCNGEVKYTLSSDSCPYCKTPRSNNESVCQSCGRMIPAMPGQSSK